MTDFCALTQPRVHISMAGLGRCRCLTSCLTTWYGKHYQLASNLFLGYQSSNRPSAAFEINATFALVTVIAVSNGLRPFRVEMKKERGEGDDQLTKNCPNTYLSTVRVDWYKPRFVSYQHRTLIGICSELLHNHNIRYMPRFVTPSHVAQVY